MQGAEDGQGDGKTQITQSYDLFDATGARDIGFGSPQRDQKDREAGAAHGERGSGQRKKCGEKSRVHIESKSRAYLERIFPGSRGFKLYNESGLIFLVGSVGESPLLEEREKWGTPLLSHSSQKQA